MPDISPLPYTDSKPVGAADFYFAINATFRFVFNRFGMDGLRRYWTEIGQRYFAPVSTAWRRHGLPGVAAYWDAFFKAEPGSDVAVTALVDQVVLDVKTCPAIAQLRKGGREIVSCFCQHCYFQEEAMAQAAGLTMRLEGGNGSCRHLYYRQADAPPPQDLARIRPCSDGAMS